MHDTFNTANATAREIARLGEEKSRELYGDEAWESMPEEERCVLDFLCGNHTRGLRVDVFNRRFEEWIEAELSSSSRRKWRAGEAREKWNCIAPINIQTHPQRMEGV